MDKTDLRKTTPGGKPQLVENPPSSEAGPKDSGGDQPLTAKNFDEETISNNEIKEENTRLKSKLEEIERLCMELRSEVTALRLENKELKQILFKNDKSQRRGGTGDMVSDEDESRRATDWILELKESKHPRNKNLNGENSSETHNEYYTDEDELALETNWSMRKKRTSKKRKADSSPETDISVYLNKNIGKFLQRNKK